MDPKLTNRDVRVLAAICMFANNQGFAWPNRSTIAKHCDMTEKNVDKALPALKRQKYIEVVSRFRSHPKWTRVMGNVYRVIFDAEMATDKLIDAMNNENDERIASEEPKTHARQLEEVEASMPADNGEKGNQRGLKGDIELVEVDGVESVAIARWFASEAQKMTGEVRIVDEAAIDAALSALSRYTVPEIKGKVSEVLMQCRQNRRPAPRHVGHLGI